MNTPISASGALRSKLEVEREYEQIARASGMTSAKAVGATVGGSVGALLGGLLEVYLLEALGADWGAFVLTVLGGAIGTYLAPRNKILGTKR